MNISHVELPGSSRPFKKGAKKLGPVDPGQLVRLTVVLRGKQVLPEPDPKAPISIAEIEANYGAYPSEIDKVRTSLAKYGIRVISTSPGARTMEVEGTVDQVEKAFEVALGMYETSMQGPYRGREGDIHIPAELSGIVTAVLGLDERRVARRRPAPVLDAPSAAPPSTGPQAPSDLEARYAFPAGTAAGQTVGVLEFGGGYWESDMALFSTQIAQQQQPPNVTVVPVGLQSLSLQQIRQMSSQQQSNELDSSGEVNMDIQIVAGLCPSADIVVYFAPFTQKGWADVLQKAVHDPNGPKVISVSWGSAEDTGDFSQAALTAINNMLQTAATVGVTICVSSGDDGAGDAVNDGKAHCDFPASSPYVLAVGGTMFPAGTEQGWWDAPGARTSSGGGASGGGRSTVFDTPSWQNVGVVSLRTNTAAGRCIPDVCALSGAPMYNLILAGQPSPNGGTSASAPLWASLIARIAGNLPVGKPIGFLTPQLYAPAPNGQPLGATVCTDITIGHNDVVPTPGSGLEAVTGYQAAPGYDAVTGWGVPNGAALQKALGGP